jgi:bud site selection protein 20
LYYRFAQILTILHCFSKHFADAKALEDHKKSRYYKRRCKELKEEKYTQEEAERAGGMTKEILPPAHAK